MLIAIDLEAKFAATVSEILEKAFITKISEKDTKHRGSARRCSVKQIFLKNLKDPQENISTGVFFNKGAG